MGEFFIFISEQWILVSVFVGLMYLFIWTEKRKGGPTLSPHEITRLINNDEGVLIDLRDVSEYKAGHIVNAINIPHKKVSDRISELDSHKSKIIILVDKMGQQAGHVGRLLGQQEFNVRRLEGGMSEWLNQKLPVVK